MLGKKNNAPRCPVAYFSMLIVLPSFQENLMKIDCPNFQVSERRTDSLNGWDKFYRNVQLQESVAFQVYLQVVLEIVSF